MPTKKDLSTQSKHHTKSIATEVVATSSSFPAAFMPSDLTIVVKLWKRRITCWSQFVPMRLPNTPAPTTSRSFAAVEEVSFP
jgi:hypothetical protein